MDDERKALSPLPLERKALSPLSPGGHTIRRRLLKQRSWSSNSSSRDEAWQRRQEQTIQEELQNLEVADHHHFHKAFSRSASDCGTTAANLPPRRRLERTRTRSLTDDDLEELRGCIDLGFGFNYSEQDKRLCDTVPALEICYAIQNFSSESGSESGGSSKSSSPVEWKISNPGDHPQQVKTRLRHWAQAVACTVRQYY